MCKAPRPKTMKGERLWLMERQYLGFFYFRCRIEQDRTSLSKTAFTTAFSRSVQKCGWVCLQALEIMG